jgi:HlyD family secretion protein
MAELQQSEANVRINEATLKRAQVDLQRCTIRAPIDGVVISRNVNIGQTVAASLSAPTLFLIVNDLSKMQIEANVAEADIGRVKVGQDVEFTVDAFPSQTFRGKVSQIRNAPITDQNVVTYGTIIEVQNPKLELKPGMTANVSVIVAHRDDAKKVSNAALRFRPPAAQDSKIVEAPAAKSPKKSSASGKKKDKQKSERTVYVQIQASGGSGTNGPATVVLQPVVIKTGITDGSWTELIDGLNEGDEVVTGVATSASGGAMSQASKLLTGQKKKKN